MTLVIHKAGRFAGHTVDLPFDVARTLVRDGLAEWPADGGVIEAKATKPGAVERALDVSAPAELVASAEPTAGAEVAAPRRRGRPPKSLTV